MTVLIGGIVVLAAVLGGYVLSHGEIAALWQPFELLIIGGAALGAFITANPTKVTIATFKQLPGLLFGKKYTKSFYLELLSLLYQVFNVIRREGLIAIERHIEDPDESELFSRFPMITNNKPALNFMCDYLRLMVIGDMTSYELENLMDVELETREHEILAPSHAVAKVADALPGFGIVAAVLGIVITMQSLGGPPEVIGIHVAAALVGTFLGILLAYGFVAPLSNVMEHIAVEESKFFECMKVCILATVNGMPPQVAVEFGRKTLYSDVRPDFYELEECVKGLR
ncbi:flagellar motor stator protein MotA [Aliikangiella coralliicola]|uniref:Flagellar motor stator protein MotA n=1 Tax=Aliikangiella coralliicola TaxID=2592383 RepID=A0A545UBX1_9GAMM|nr:flagellar motor stator protein MotA [Aliikangiella coralliicola]TQV86971.1 flagellar motor stator protein MotA [Aliikangiella coralliicola]